MAAIVEPVHLNVPIVDPATGKITPYFQRILNQIATGAGLTVGQGGVIEAEVTQAELDALTLDDLADVDTTSTPPTDGDGLVYDGDTSLWVPGVVSSGGGMTPFQGCLLTKSAAQTAVNFTAGAVITWDSEIYDTDGFHDNVTNNSRITIPAGVTKVRLHAQVYLVNSAATTFCHMHIVKNVSATAVADQLIMTNATTMNQIVSTPILDVSAGDYFVVNINVGGADTSIDVTNANSWFSCEVIQSNSVVGNTFAGARVRKAADLTAQNLTAGAVVTWDTEDYDTLGFHSTSADTSRLTIPAGVTKVRLVGALRLANIAAGSGPGIFLRKNGTTIFAEQASANDLTIWGAVVDSGVVDVSTGDYFELFVQNSTDTSVDIVAARSFFALEVIQGSQPYADTNFAGCLLKKAADHTGQNFTTATAVTWDTEEYDTLGFHDTSSNTSRITIPSGVTKVRLQGQIELANVTNDVYTALSIRKNGTTTWTGMPGAFTDLTAPFPSINIASSIVNVSAGDYFELFLVVQTDTSVDIESDRSWFALEVIEYTTPRTTTFSGAKVRKAAALTGQNLTTAAAVVWTAEDWDTDGYHDLVSNTSRLTCTVGGKFEVRAQAVISNVTASEWVALIINRYNNASVLQESVASTRAAIPTTGPRLNLSATVQMSAGDYVECYLQVQTDTSVDIETSSWFEIRRLEQ